MNAQSEHNNIRIKHANLHSLIQDQLQQSFPAPVHTNPKPSPLIPCIHGPVEMPILMDGHPHQVKCFCCRKQGDKAQECPQKKGKTCTICGDRKEKKASCPYHQPPKVEVEVEVEVCKDIKELGKMSLLDQIVLLDPLHWTPPVCTKCGKQQPRHGEMECLQYEYCGQCRQHRSYRFIRRHKCQMVDQDNPMSLGWDDCDVDLWANNN